MTVEASLSISLKLDLLNDCKIYYANPYAPHERGSNENHNGLLREYFPKPFNFKNVSQRIVDDAVENLNTRPRKILKWKTPA